MLRKLGVTGLAILAGLGVGALARAEDPATLTVSAGSWETLRDNDRKAEVDIDYRSNIELWFVRPQAGILIAGDGDYYAYGGFVTDIDLVGPFVLTLSTAIGGYGGHGFDLGSHFEFRNGLEVAYKFDNNWRIGGSFYHISNAGITRENGGSESTLLSLTIPLGF